MRAAYPERPWYWELEYRTPRHGSRPFEIVHIDHTELDIEVCSSSTGELLGKPWVTFMMDAYSRRLLAVYLTFDPPSYRSVMMVLRICVQRFERFVLRCQAALGCYIHDEQHLPFVSAQRRVLAVNVLDRDFVDGSRIDDALHKQ